MMLIIIDPFREKTNKEKRVVSVLIIDWKLTSWGFNIKPAICILFLSPLSGLPIPAPFFLITFYLRGAG